MRRGVHLLRWAERVWPTRNEAKSNREGVASGSATLNLFFFIADKNLQSDWLLKELFKVARCIFDNASEITTGVS